MEKVYYKNILFLLRNGRVFFLGCSVGDRKDIVYILEYTQASL